MTEPRFVIHTSEFGGWHWVEDSDAGGRAVASFIAEHRQYAEEHAARLNVRALAEAIETTREAS